MTIDSMKDASANALEDREGTPAELGQRWHRNVVLKRDIFSIVERGTYRGPDGDVDAVARRIDHVPWWTFAFARNFFIREERAPTVVGPPCIAPLLYFSARPLVVRRWIARSPLHLALSRRFLGPLPARASPRRIGPLGCSRQHSATINAESRRDAEGQRARQQKMELDRVRTQRLHRGPLTVAAVIAAGGTCAPPVLDPIHRAW